jgi:peptidoglycan/xylan/chitin deacetylase (PgdA/CDA1 family)
MAISSFLRIAIIRIASLFYVSGKSKVIFYHDIHSDKRYTDMSTPIDLFKKHINIIRQRGYEIVSEITKEKGQIEICFDDAYLGLHDNIELIKEQNIPIHLFVISSYMNKENYISKEQLIELNKLKQIAISSHTHQHKILNQLSEIEIIEELQKSKNYLDNLLNKTIDSICFPEGKFNKIVIHLAKKIGYERQYSSLPGFYSSEVCSGVKKRSLVQFAGEEEFKAILKGGDHILAFWYKFKQFKK